MPEFLLRGQNSIARKNYVVKIYTLHTKHEINCRTYNVAKTEWHNRLRDRQMKN
jgi:hypothetical protein